MTCSTCGRENPPHLTFCQECGQRLGPRIAPPTPPIGLGGQDAYGPPPNVQPAPRAATSLGMANSALDHTPAAPPVVAAAAASGGERRCKICDTVNGPNLRYCTSCGSTLEPAPVAAAARSRRRCAARGCDPLPRERDRPDGRAELGARAPTARGGGPSARVEFRERRARGYDAHVQPMQRHRRWDGAVLQVLRERARRALPAARSRERCARAARISLAQTAPRTPRNPRSPARRPRPSRRSRRRCSRRCGRCRRSPRLLSPSPSPIGPAAPVPAPAERSSSYGAPPQPSGAAALAAIQPAPQPTSVPTPAPLPPVPRRARSADASS